MGEQNEGYENIQPKSSGYSTQIPSAEGQSEESHQRRVRQRVSRACDSCRKHKVKCLLREDGSCQNCLTAGRPCTFETVGIKRDRPPTKGDVERLNRKIRSLEKVLSVVAPNFDLKALPRTADQARSIARIMNARTNQPFTGAPPKPAQRNFSPQDVHSAIKLLGDFCISSHYSVEGTSVADPSRGCQLKEATSKAQSLAYDLGREMPRSFAADYVNKRFEYNHLIRFQLPPADLAYSLFDLFFEKVNPFENLLHREEFMALYRSGLAETNTSFLGLCFAVFTAGSRFSSDPRVFPSPTEGVFNRQAAGAIFLYNSLSLISPETAPFTLYDLQATALLCYITIVACSPLTAWFSIASNVRRAQSSGAEREDALYWKSSIMADQLRKRAVWYVATMELQVCGALGRTISLKDYGLNLKLPLSVDDDTLTRISSMQKEQPSPATFDSIYSTLENLPSTPSQKAWKAIYSFKVRFGLAAQKLSAVKTSPDTKLWECDRDMLFDFIKEVEKYIDKDISSKQYADKMVNLTDFLVTARHDCTMLGVQILFHRLLVGSDPSEIAVCQKASNTLIDIMDHIRNLGLLEHTAAWLPYLVTPPALTLLFVARGKRHSMQPMDRANAWAGVHRCINILNSMAPWSFISEKLGISVDQLVQVCINEELFMNPLGVIGNEKKRSARDAIDGVRLDEEESSVQNGPGDFSGPLVQNDLNILDSQSARLDSQSDNPNPEEPVNKTDSSLTSEEVFAIPHSQLDAMLFEHPGKKLAPGLNLVGSPEWLNFTTPTEAVLEGTSFLDLEFLKAEDALISDWKNKNFDQV